MRKALGIAFFVGLILLALNALIVSPEADAFSSPLPSYPAEVKAVFLPAPLPQSEQAQNRMQDLREVFVCLCALLSIAFPCLSRRDSNGRVLRSRRYENSVYQVFRPEVAGG